MTNIKKREKMMNGKTIRDRLIDREWRVSERACDFWISKFADI